MDEAELEKVLDRINGWIVAADQKISIALALTLGLISLAAKPTIDLVAIYKTRISILSIIILVISTSVLIYALFKLLLAISPRVKSKAKSLIFFGSISKLSQKEYLRAINGLSPGTYKKDVAEQIHTNSVICSKKHSHYKDSVKLLVAGAVLWIIFLSTIAGLVNGR